MMVFLLFESVKSFAMDIKVVESSLSASTYRITEYPTASTCTGQFLFFQDNGGE